MGNHSKLPENKALVDRSLFTRLMAIGQVVGCICRDDATLLMGSPDHEQFGDDPALLQYFPSTEDVARAGSLAAALVINEVPPPKVLCCGAPRIPKVQWL